MTTVADQLEIVYTELGRVLHNPEAFDLGPDVPPRLASSLAAAFTTLGQAIKELRTESRDEDLAAELSEDADRPSPA